MKKFGENMSVQVKLMILFLILSVTIAGLGITAWYAINSLNKNLEFVSADTIPRLEILGDIEKNIIVIQRGERSLLIQEFFDDERERANQIKILNGTWQLIEEDCQSLEKLSSDVEDKKVWDTFKENLNNWKKQHNKVIEFINNNNRDGALEQSEDQARTAAIVTKKAATAVVEFNKELVSSTQQKSEKSAKRFILIIIVGSLIAVVFSVIFGGIASTYLKNSILKIYDKISEAVIRVKTAVAEVSTSSNQVANGASNQAASLEEISSSLEETSAMTRNNAENASKADVLMHGIREKISGTSNDMKLLKKSMEEITTASAQTQKIVKTIDEIAFQTNLLALNAAVEAARAGEAGAGFAVVADEVRNLAKRAASAAKDTSELIEGTIKKVEAGSGVVTNTTRNFDEIEGASGGVATLVSEIAGASAEQDKGISEITKAVGEIDQVTQNNAANAEESAAAAQDVDAQVGLISNLMDDLNAFINGK